MEGYFRTTRSSRRAIEDPPVHVGVKSRVKGKRVTRAGASNTELGKSFADRKTSSKEETGGVGGRGSANKVSHTPVPANLSAKPPTDMRGAKTRDEIAEARDSPAVAAPAEQVHESDAVAMEPPASGLVAPTTPSRGRDRAPVKTATPTGSTAVPPPSASSMTPSKDRTRAVSRMTELSVVVKNNPRRCFGSPMPMKDRVHVPLQVGHVYKMVNKATGTVGGNGFHGAIYGELTVGCMQKVVNVMKEHCGFDKRCSFIDVGSGLGKPNFHVAQDPGCEISYGLELEDIRWRLSIVNLRRQLLDDTMPSPSEAGVACQKGNVFFGLGDITSASTFNPFTHVYMFDIGFPPATLRTIAQMFNRSDAEHLISYQTPRRVMGYGFDVDEILKMPLCLTGSGEGHTMYLYRRKGVPAGKRVEPIAKVDPLFSEGVRLCRDRRGSPELLAWVQGKFSEHTEGGVRTRRGRRRAEEAAAAAAAAVAAEAEAEADMAAAT